HAPQDTNGNRESASFLPLAVGVPEAAILLLAFAVRIYRLGAQSLWVDEAFSINGARLGPLLSGVQDPGQPPLYGVLLALWVPLAGAGEFAARYLSLIAGVAAVAL